MKFQFACRQMFFYCLVFAASPAFGAQTLTKVIMTSGSFSEREAAMYVAQDQGIFRRYGLELTFVTVRNGPAITVLGLSNDDIVSDVVPLTVTAYGSERTDSFVDQTTYSPLGVCLDSTGGTRGLH